MKAVVAMDSFKGSMLSLEAGNAAAEGIRRVYPDAEIAVRPLADGGEGTVEALTAGMGGTLRTISVTGPAGRPVDCSYGMVEEHHMAVIEMAGAAGLTLVAPEERNPLIMTTFGVGELILDAIDCGCRRFVIGIGGSATNDGGTGMLQALGFELRDAEGGQIPFGAAGLEKLSSISARNVCPKLAECKFRIACDVDNVLCGRNGCSVVYGPQKGADPQLTQDMDRWMDSYSKIAAERFPKADPCRAGAGAAGGLGFAFLTFMNAELRPGISIVLQETGLEEYIRKADIILTGEGRLDGQTVMGKAPSGVAKLSKKYGKPVIAFAGCVRQEASVCNEAGIDAYFSILQEAVSLSEAMDGENAKRNMCDTVEQVFRMIRLFGEENA